MEFVSFEIAKKLKDLGFDESSLFFYREDDEDKCVHCVDINKPLTHYNGAIIAPTISQVLKWLRDNKILIIPVPSYFNAEGICISWDCDIWADDNYECCRGDKKTYEEAALAGIEYVLNNIL